MLECPLCAAGSTGHCNTARSLSAGVSNPKVFRGRWLSRRAILFRLAWEKCESSVPRGKYCRSKPLVFSLLPRCQGLRGSQKIDLHVGGDGEVLVVSHLLASIPGQGAAQLLGQFAHVFTERGYYGRRVLARDFEKHH